MGNCTLGSNFLPYISLPKSSSIVSLLLRTGVFNSWICTYICTWRWRLETWNFQLEILPDSLFSGRALLRWLRSDLRFTSLMIEEALSGILAKLFFAGVRLYDVGVANIFNFLNYLKVNRNISILKGPTSTWKHRHVLSFSQFWGNWVVLFWATWTAGVAGRGNLSVGRGGAGGLGDNFMGQRIKSSILQIFMTFKTKLWAAVNHIIWSSWTCKTVQLISQHFVAIYRDKLTTLSPYKLGENTRDQVNRMCSVPPIP